MKLKKIMRYFAIPALALSLPLFSGVGDVGQLNRNNDQGFWLTEELIKDVTKQAFFRLNFEQRWGNKYRTFWYHHYEVVGQFDFGPYIKESLCLCPGTNFRSLTFGPGFREAIFIDRNNTHKFVWASANIPVLEANLNFMLFGGLLRQRFRGEYVNHNTKHFHDHGLFRYKIYYFTPWRWGRINFNPWVANEVFIREKTKDGRMIIQTGPYYENRFSVGANARLAEHLFVDLYWQWRRFEQLPGYWPHWANTYQIGASAIFVF